MTLQSLFDVITARIGPLIKIFLLLLIFLYGVFAAVVVRQIQLMNKVVNEVNFSIILFTIALTHFMATVILFLIALMIL